MNEPMCIDREIARAAILSVWDKISHIKMGSIMYSKDVPYAIDGKIDLLKLNRERFIKLIEPNLNSDLPGIDGKIFMISMSGRNMFS